MKEEIIRMIMEINSDGFIKMIYGFVSQLHKGKTEATESMEEI